MKQRKRTPAIRVTIWLLCQGLVWLTIPAWGKNQPKPFLPNRKWNQEVIYFALTDRFLDGDPANNIPAGSDPNLYDATQTDLNKYHGGDLRGLELALKAGYFNRLGITALWITPPVKNTWFSKVENKTGYHGYWAQDFLDIDPHLVSRTKLNGGTYPDTREGRLEHYRDFIELAHKKGIKVIQDIVCNHAGPVFYYDSNGNGKFDQDFTDANQSEWIQPFLPNGRHENTRWADIQPWNLQQTQPAGPVTLKLRGNTVTVKTSGILSTFEAYGRRGYREGSLGKSDGEEVTCDFFALRDFETAPTAPRFDQLTEEFAEIYAFYVRELGVDALRVDTVKHVHHEFWDAMFSKLRAKIGPERARNFFIFGETYSGNPADIGRTTYRKDGKTGPCLDSMLNFQFCFNARNYLRVENNGYGDSTEIVNTLREMYEGKDAQGRPFYNPEPGPDGLTAREKLVTFLENHDGLNRFRAQGISAENNRLQLGLLAVMEGIPCIYYGSEADLQASGSIKGDSETGRMTFCKPGDVQNLKKVEAGKTFRMLSTLLALRRKFPALQEGKTNVVWSDTHASQDDDGVLALVRYTEKNGVIDPRQTMLVVINAHPDKAGTTTRQGETMVLVSRDGKPVVDRRMVMDMQFPFKQKDINPVDRIPVHWKGGQPTLTLGEQPKSITIYRALRPPITYVSARGRETENHWRF
ncbi:MAG: hypothetical protein K1Y36_09485 [Blastocatellia bacterium]|nr:hypothetical protein [Blastocatellia bacterium]